MEVDDGHFQSHIHVSVRTRRALEVNRRHLGLALHEQRIQIVYELRNRLVIGVTPRIALP
jgi:hypothetical protein